MRREDFGKSGGSPQVARAPPRRGPRRVGPEMRRDLPTKPNQVGCRVPRTSPQPLVRRGALARTAANMASGILARARPAARPRTEHGMCNLGGRPRAWASARGRQDTPPPPPLLGPHPSRSAPAGIAHLHRKPVHRLAGSRSCG